MTKLFKPIISVWRLYKKVKSLKLAYQLLPNVFTPSVNAPVKFKNGKLVFNGVDRIFTKKQLSLFGDHGELLLKFLKSGNISFTEPIDDTEIVSVQFNDKKILLNIYDYNSLKVIDEIFIDQLYDFLSKDEYVVCDVGMNMAATSLYFASFDNVSKVYGYEPFPQTYTLAKKNIDLNTGIKNKVEIFNYGLGEGNHSVNVPDPKDGFLGGTTTDFVISELTDELKKNNIKVEIRDICGVMEYIKQNNPGKKIILKLDCEGAEYEIMNAIQNAGKVNDIDIYMVEYHFKGKMQIAETLLSNGFIIMSPGNEQVNPFGMLYAVKS